MGQPLNSEIERFLQSLNDVDHGGETDQDEMETVDVYFVRREAEIEPQDAIVDATPAQPTCGPSALFTSATIFFCVGILFSAIALQLYLAVNPPVATITIVPDTKTTRLRGKSSSFAMRSPRTERPFRLVRVSSASDQNCSEVWRFAE